MKHLDGIPTLKHGILFSAPLCFRVPTPKTNCPRNVSAKFSELLQEDYGPQFLPLVPYSGIYCPCGRVSIPHREKAFFQSIPDQSIDGVNRACWKSPDFSLNSENARIISGFYPLPTLYSNFGCKSECAIVHSTSDTYPQNGHFRSSTPWLWGNCWLQ